MLGDDDRRMRDASGSAPAEATLPRPRASSSSDFAAFTLGKHPFRLAVGQMTRHIRTSRSSRATARAVMKSKVPSHSLDLACSDLDLPQVRARRSPGGGNRREAAAVRSASSGLPPRMAITSPGSPRPSRCRTNCPAFRAKPRSWAPSRMWRFQSSSMRRGAIRFCRCILRPDQLGEALQLLECFT